MSYRSTATIAFLVKILEWITAKTRFFFPSRKHTLQLKQGPNCFQPHLHFLVWRVKGQFICQAPACLHTFFLVLAEVESRVWAEFNQFSTLHHLTGIYRLNIISRICNRDNLHRLLPSSWVNHSENRYLNTIHPLFLKLRLIKLETCWHWCKAVKLQKVLYEETQWY